jgi:hypothetical protein
MHSVAHEVAIPTEQVERELQRRARPGFNGSVTINLRLKPEAALSVWFTVESREVTKTGRQDCTSPERGQLFGNGNPTERELMIRAELARQQHRFRLATSLSKVIGHFEDGKLQKVEYLDVRDKWPNQ